MVDAARLEAYGCSKGESQVTDNNNELHVVFGTGPVGMAIMDELESRGKRVRMINRGGMVNLPQSVEAVGAV